MSFLFRLVICVLLFAGLYSCSSANSANDNDSEADMVSATDYDVPTTNQSGEADQVIESDIEDSLPQNTLRVGSVAFWDQKNATRVYLSRSDYAQLSDNLRKRLKPLGLIIELGTQYYILNRNRKSKDTDWYSAMKAASECHPYDDARWNLPSLSEARQIAKVQNDIVYWIKRWEADHPRVFFDYNGENIETFVSDNSSSVFTDVTISDGQIEVNKVQRCDADRAKDYPYTTAYYISKISKMSTSRTADETVSPSSNNSSAAMQVWKQCMSCLGTGQCSYCYGQGVYSDYSGTHDCPCCIEGRCRICAGQGGHYEVEYR